MELVDIPDLKSVDREVVGVRLPPLVPEKEKKMTELKILAGALVLISLLYLIWRD